MSKRPRTHRRPASRATPRGEGSFYRRLIDGMRCGIIVIDAGGSLVRINDLGREILELTGPAEPGSKVEDVLSDHPRLVHVLREAFSMSTLPNRAELELRCRSNRGKTIGFTLSLVPGGDGVPAGAAIFFKDLTWVEHQEEQARLKDRLAALGQMAASMAHEIRNPLASIEVTASLLRRAHLAIGPERELLDKISSELRRINQTITSSLDFVRPIAPNFISSRIEPVLDDGVQVAVERNGAAGVNIERFYQPGLPPLPMDASLLRQVFENLCLNALEAMDKGGTLSVTAERSPDAGEIAAGQPLRYISIRVEDTGPGISPQHMDRIFYPFFTSKSQGSGVGLPMARKIVDAHHGFIDVANRAGGGAVLTVRLPAVQLATVATMGVGLK